jgi:hypothetical protein
VINAYSNRGTHIYVIFFTTMFLLVDESREQNGKMLPNVSNNTCNENESSPAELVSVNGSSNTSSNSSNYPYAVYSGSSHLPNSVNSTSGVGMSSCYSSYPSNYSSQQLYSSQVSEFRFFKLRVFFKRPA